MDYLTDLKNNYEIFLSFMKGKYPVFNKSNIFLRDIQYTIKSYFQKKDFKLNNSEIEKLTKEFISFLEVKNILKKINKNTWELNFSFENNVIK